LSINNLVNLLKEKEDAIKDQKVELEKVIIPQIEKKRKLTTEKQEATVYESFEGLKSAFNLILETLGSGEEYYVFMLGESLKERRVINFFMNYHHKRIEKGIHVKLISRRKFRQVVEKEHKKKKTQVRYIDRILPVGTFIFKNHVMTVVFEDKPTAFVIKSEKNYNYYKEFFESVWKGAKK